MSAEISNVVAELVSSGWREYPDQFDKYARNFYKRFNTPTRCSLNESKPGVQVCIMIYDNPGHGPSMEMKLSAGLPDDTWIVFHNYALPKTVPEVTALIPRLLYIWEAANEFTKNK